MDICCPWYIDILYVASLLKGIEKRREIVRMGKIKFETGTWKRILWLSLVNVSVIVTLAVLTGGGIITFLPFLLLYACVMPFISLLFSKFVAKKAYRLQVLSDDCGYEDTIEWYRETTYEICRKAGMEKMPELAVYDSHDKNAFATGRSKNSSLIAVSSALLYEMSEDAVEAVIAHEVSHIMNGDMVTQTLLQSAVNMVIGVIILPITAVRWFALFSANDRDSVILYYLIAFGEFIVGTVLFFLSGLIVKKFSRQREFKADYLAAQLTTPDKMICALKELGGPAIILPEQKKFAALQFNGANRILDLFSTHPSLERRIQQLEKQFITY